MHAEDAGGLHHLAVTAAVTACLGLRSLLRAGTLAFAATLVTLEVKERMPVPVSVSTRPEVVKSVPLTVAVPVPADLRKVPALVKEARLPEPL